MHTWVKSKQQNTIRDGGNTAARYTVLLTLMTTLGQLWDNYETTLGQLWDEFETAFKQFCDFFEKNFWGNFRTTLRHLTLITLNEFWDYFEKPLGQLWVQVVTTWWLLAERTSASGQNMAIFHKGRVWRLKSYQKKMRLSPSEAKMVILLFPGGGHRPGRRRLEGIWSPSPS